MRRFCAKETAQDSASYGAIGFKGKIVLFPQTTRGEDGAEATLVQNATSYIPRCLAPVVPAECFGVVTQSLRVWLAHCAAVLFDERKFCKQPVDIVCDYLVRVMIKRRCR